MSSTSSTTTPFSARTFLVHGLLAGIVGGILAFGVAFTVGEPPIDAAIAVEEAGSGHAHGESVGSAVTLPAHGDEEEGGITRGQQAGPGLATATILFGVVLGGVVGIASAFAVGRLAALRPVASTALVAGVGWLAYTVVPFLKYPPNPPAVGSGDTIGERTALYFSFVLISVLAAIAAVLVAREVLRRFGGWAGVVAGALVFGVVVLVAGLVMAPIDEVPDGFPPNTLYDFRIGALATATALWAGIALVLTGLTARTWRRQVADDERRAAAAAL